MANPLPLLAFIGATFNPTLPEVDRAALAHHQLVVAVGNVESGMNHNALGDQRRARGAWQMWALAWIDGNGQLKKEGRQT